LAWKKERNERKIRFKGERKFFGLFFYFLGRKNTVLAVVSFVGRTFVFEGEEDGFVSTTVPRHSAARQSTERQGSKCCGVNAILWVCFMLDSGICGMVLYHPLDGVTNLEYNLLCFLKPNKIIF
jgi:hypothetical protein